MLLVVVIVDVVLVLGGVETVVVGGVGVSAYHTRYAKDLVISLFVRLISTVNLVSVVVKTVKSVQDGLCSIFIK